MIVDDKIINEEQKIYERYFEEMRKYYVWIEKNPDATPLEKSLRFHECDLARQRMIREIEMVAAIRSQAQQSGDGPMILERITSQTGGLR